jgi:DNA topoisomerase IB
VHPGIVAAWEEGSLQEEMAQLRRRFRRAPHGLDREENVLLQWLLEWNDRNSGENGISQRNNRR